MTNDVNTLAAFSVLSDVGEYDFVLSENPPNLSFLMARKIDFHLNQAVVSFWYSKIHDWREPFIMVLSLRSATLEYFDEENHITFCSECRRALVWGGDYFGCTS